MSVVSSQFGWSLKDCFLKKNSFYKYSAIEGVRLCTGEECENMFVSKNTTVSNNLKFLHPSGGLCKNLPGCFLKTVMPVLKLISQKHNKMCYIFMQSFNTCELHAVVNRPLYQEM